MPYSDIWADTIRAGVCKGPQCRKSIYFAENARTGREMPFNHRPEPTAVQPEIETGRERWTVNLSDSHFATCPNAPTFRTKGTK